jgi:hypothetical protein
MVGTMTRLVTCIIMHNMIIEDEREFANDQNFERPDIHADPSTGSDRVRGSFVQRLHKLKDKGKHHQLQNDLIEHQWIRYGRA